MRAVTFFRLSILGLRAIVCISVFLVFSHVPRAAAQDTADALRNMFEKFGQQSEQFVPGMFSELSPAQMAELEKIPVSKREESEFGDQVLKNYEATLRTQNQSVKRDGKDVRYLSQLVSDIRPNMSNVRRYPRIDIALVDTERIDAYSIPGGHLMFTTGLLKDVQSEAELVGVICHELSHLDRGHQLLPLRQSKRANTVMDFRSSMQWIALVAKPFRPEFESQADADAVRWMLAEGYDARELGHLLIRWDARQDQQAGWTNMLPSFARSHPDSGRRAKIVLDKVDLTPITTEKLIIGKDNLASRIAKSQSKRP
ncbi:MAG TPA: M48 family metallopeptidase [Pirellula sp.]|nr:M48 family metallopeptidase [Pirellula sp.]